ncbi:MAG TPA: hypothetical protein VJH03_15495 [Blastocatellia bacterium]|nr:hypothetical protein [Blastocatellia bacterium]
MTDELDGDPHERIRFWRGWKGLYLFIIVYGAIQIALLYVFTLMLNHS